MIYFADATLRTVLLRFLAVGIMGPLLDLDMVLESPLLNTVPESEKSLSESVLSNNSNSDPSNDKSKESSLIDVYFLLIDNNIDPIFLNSGRFFGFESQQCLINSAQSTSQSSGIDGLRLSFRI